jgi:hypothetical protein
MDEMSVRLGDGTNLGAASLFDFTNMPSLLGGRRGKELEMQRTRAGGGPTVVWKDKSFFKNPKTWTKHCWSNTPVHYALGSQ